MSEIYNVENINPVHINGTIIIVAIYINNDLNNYNELIKCLIQLRNIYTNEIIIAVDNCSLNNKWHDEATKLNINILHNNSILHKFESGAYKKALQHFRADKYIFIQGTIFINNKLDLSLLDTNEEMGIAFLNLDNLCWEPNVTFFINKLLLEINMKKRDNEDGHITWCSFCANNSFVNKMLNDRIFDLPSNTKAHSCAFENILGCYFTKVLKNIKSIEDQNSFKKIYLKQEIPFFPQIE